MTLREAIDEGVAEVQILGTGAASGNSIIIAVRRLGDRLATIRAVHQAYGVVVDTHTADGLFVAERWREPGVPMICLETAQPAKFAASIREALGIEPPRPAAYEGIESRAQRYTLMPRDVRLLARFIASRAASAAG